jgi:hypothetical protein
MALANRRELTATSVSDALKGLEFDGKVEINSSTNGLTTGNTSHTIETWLYINNIPPARMGVLDLLPQNTGGHHWLLNSNGSLQIGVWSGALQVSPTPPIGEWFHLIVTYDASSFAMKAYINGLLVKSNTIDSTNDMNLSGGFVIGEGVSSERKFEGLFEVIRLYNFALTTTEVEENYKVNVTRNGLVSEFDFSIFGEGSTISDTSGKGNDGSISGGARWLKHKAKRTLTAIR